MCPSKLRKLYWTHSHYDLQHMVSLRVQEHLVRVVQERETFRDVIAEALGTKTEPVESEPISSYDELASLFSQRVVRFTPDPLVFHHHFSSYKAIISHPIFLKTLRGRHRCPTKAKLK